MIQHPGVGSTRGKAAIHALFGDLKKKEKQEINRKIEVK